MYIAQVNFHHGYLYGGYGITYSVAVMGIRTCVYDHTVKLLASQMQLVDYLALMVGLKYLAVHTQRHSVLGYLIIDGLESIRAIYARFSFSEKIEVWSVYQKYFSHIKNSFLYKTADEHSLSAYLIRVSCFALPCLWRTLFCALM